LKITQYIVASYHSGRLLVFILESRSQLLFSDGPSLPISANGLYSLAWSILFITAAAGVRLVP